jgi:hypothetical protein
LANKTRLPLLSLRTTGIIDISRTFGPQKIEWTKATRLSKQTRFDEDWESQSIHQSDLQNNSGNSNPDNNDYSHFQNQEKLKHRSSRGVESSGMKTYWMKQPLTHR